VPPYIRQSSTKVSARHPGSLWIETNRKTLPNNHWVAASAEGLQASATRIDELVNAIQKQAISPAQLAITFITEDAL